MFGRLDEGERWWENGSLTVFDKTMYAFVGEIIEVFCGDLGFLTDWCSQLFMKITEKVFWFCYFIFCDDCICLLCFYDGIILSIWITKSQNVNGMKLKSWQN